MPLACAMELATRYPMVLRYGDSSERTAQIRGIFVQAEDELGALPRWPSASPMPATWR
jgi:hypothetical protein